MSSRGKGSPASHSSSRLLSCRSLPSSHRDLTTGPQLAWCLRLTVPTASVLASGPQLAPNQKRAPCTRPTSIYPVFGNKYSHQAVLYDLVFICLPGIGYWIKAPQTVLCWFTNKLMKSQKHLKANAYLYKTIWMYFKKSDDFASFCKSDDLKVYMFISWNSNTLSFFPPWFTLQMFVISTLVVLLLGCMV